VVRTEFASGVIADAPENVRPPVGAVAGLRWPAPTVALDAILGLAEKAHQSAVAAVVRRRL
jgi:hypothetical protein